MDETVFDEMANYFEAVAGQLQGEAHQAKLLDNPSVVGDDREEVYRRFLERHLPKSCEVFRGGYVFDIAGRRSRQTDVVVTSGLTPRFEMGSGGRSIAPIEGTAAVAEIKSRLDKAELVKSLDALQELPQIEADAAKVSPMLKTGPNFSWDRPYKVIFAYQGLESETIYHHLVDYYRRNPDVPQERRPSLVHVLGKYAIFRITDGLSVMEADGTTALHQPSVGEYWSFSRDSDLMAMSFMLTTIQKNLFLANYMLVKYSTYIAKIADIVIRRPWPR